MAIQAIQEKLTTDNDRIEQPYYIYDDGDPPATITEAEARAAGEAQAFIDYGSQPLQFKCVQISNHSFRYTATFFNVISQINPVTPPEPGVSHDEYRFRFQAKPKKIFYLDDEKITGYPGTAPSTRGMVGLQRVNGIVRHVGIQTTVPPVTNEVTLIRPNALITPALMKEYETLAGKVNQSPWTPFWRESGDPYEAGEIMVVSIDGSTRTNLDWQIHIGFAHLPEITESIGDFEVTRSQFDDVFSIDFPVKLGDVETVDPKFVYVIESWERVEFPAL